MLSKGTVKRKIGHLVAIEGKEESSSREKKPYGSILGFKEDISFSDYGHYGQLRYIKDPRQFRKLLKNYVHQCF